MDGINYQQLLDVAITEARLAQQDGSIPLGAAIFDRTGKLLGKSHNRLGNHSHFSLHSESNVFDQVGQKQSYRDKIMVTTLAPCKHCSDLIRQHNIGTVVVGESVSFMGGVYWLREMGVNVIDLNSPECFGMMANYMHHHPHEWEMELGEAVTEVFDVAMSVA